MKLKEWLEYEEVFTRKDLIRVVLASSFPLGICGYMAAFWLILFKPHIKGGKWKKKIK